MLCYLGLDGWTDCRELSEHGREGSNFFILPPRKFTILGNFCAKGQLQGRASLPMLAWVLNKSSITDLCESMHFMNICVSLFQSLWSLLQCQLCSQLL